METIDEWATVMTATGMRPNTVALRTRAIRHLCRHAGVESPSGLTRRHVAAWLARDLQPNSRRVYWTSVHAWCEWCAEWGVPCADLLAGLPRPHNQPLPPRPLPRAVVRALLDLDCSARTYSYLRLGLFAGLRSCEIAAVQGRDLVDGRLRIEGKGGSVGWVHAHAEVVALADLWGTASWWFPGIGGHEHVIPEVVQQAVKRALVAVGYKRGTTHQLRHSYGTAVQQAQGDIRVTQQALRHAAISSTMIYTGVSEARLDGAVDGLSWAA